MNVLIVHAHHEPASFSSALARKASQVLTGLGHQVTFSDLYATGFNPVSDRTNFTSRANPDFLKQQAEETHATEVSGFAPELEAEIARLEACDLLIFSFPLWWFGMPGILKGWVDRVFAMGRIYGNGKLYENGLGAARKKAMVLMTTGGGPDAYGGFGVNPSLRQILAPIEHGVFWFNGFLPLDPFVAWSPARIGQPDREAFLAQLEQRLRGLEQELPRRLPPLSDFPGFSQDTKRRYMSTLSLKKPVDEAYLSAIPEETARVQELKRSGVLLEAYIGEREQIPWHAFLLWRESTAEAVLAHVHSLPLAAYFEVEVTELRQV
ncbi:MAG: NAD(P)H-dependent oxidoreductase [Vulcanimicrobiota bacterium]